MSLKETFLLLAPEFGGTKFGPFKGMEIRLGSDPSRNDIVLPEALGVLPEHVRLIGQGDGTWIVAPVERTAGVFVWRSGQRPKQVTTPIAITAAEDSYSADAISVVTAEGPKFFLLQEIRTPQKKQAESNLSRAAGRLNRGSLWTEVKRQGIASVVTTRAGANAQFYWHYIRTGAAFHPRNIVTFAMGSVGWVMAGLSGGLMCNLASSKATAEVAVQECQTDLGVCRGLDGGSATPRVEQLAAKILNARVWQDALSQDEELRVAYVAALSDILKNQSRADRYRWVYTQPGSDFAILRKQLAQRGMEPSLLSVVPYIAAQEGPVTNQEWHFIAEDSEGQEACGRGPMALTWRQATQLGFTNVQPDAAVESNVARSEDAIMKLDRLTTTASSISGREPPELAGMELTEAGAGTQGAFTCISVVGDDSRSRDSISDLAGDLTVAVGSGASGLPPLESRNGLSFRLAKVFAADATRGFADADWKANTVDEIIDKKLNPKAQRYVIEHTAEVLARATAIPCLAVLDKNSDPPTHLGDGLPNVYDCIVLTGGIQYDQLQK